MPSSTEEKPRTGVLRSGTDGDRVTGIRDAVCWVSYVHGGGPASDPLWTGDGNCDGTVKFGNVVFPVTYLFRGSPPPIPIESGNAEGDGIRRPK